MVYALQVNTNLAPLDALIGKISEMGESKIPEMAAKEAQKHAKELVPVRTGALKGSIIVVQLESNAWALIAAMPYAGFVEWGTSKMAAQPYMIPANEMIDWPAIIDIALRWR